TSSLAPTWSITPAYPGSAPSPWLTGKVRPGPVLPRFPALGAAAAINDVVELALPKSWETGPGTSRNNSLVRIAAVAPGHAAATRAPRSAAGVANAASGSISDVGGSAMPCGLVLLAARAKVAAAVWLPDVRVAAPTYW